MISIKEIMKKDFSKLSFLDSVESAVELIEKRGVDYLLIEEEGEIKGVVTSRELVGYPSSRLLLDCKIKPIATISEETWLEEALKVLEEKEVNFLVILNREGNPIGVINKEIIISFLYQEVKKSNKEKEEQITERKRAEEQIKVSLKEKEVLLQEVHHRVKNNLQLISSLLKLQSEYIKDKKSIQILKESQNRIKSLALIHERLYRSKDLVNVDFNEYIKTQANSLFQSYDTTGKIALKIDVKDVLLGIDAAIPCGLIINELISNSLKHAFPEGREGEIKIALRSTAENEIELVVSDNGVGMPEDLDFRNTESFGLHLVTILAEDQLQGKIELDRMKGTRFRITFS